MSFDAIQSATRSLRHERDILSSRWQQLQPYADRFATVFVDTLFAHQTDFRELFGGRSLQAQFVLLAHVLTQIVCADDDRDAMDVRVELIVRRFARDDSSTRQSRAMRAAVAATLREVTGAGMSAHTRLSWKAAYAAVGAILHGTVYLDTRAISGIRPAALKADIGDRCGTSIEQRMEPTADSQAA
jgi:hemoglobin-like flavoprotein